MDALRAQETEFGARAGIDSRLRRVAVVARHAVHRHCAMGQRGSGTPRAGAPHQRMVELPGEDIAEAGIAPRWERDEIHDAEVDALHLRQFGDAGKLPPDRCGSRS